MTSDVSSAKNPTGRPWGKSKMRKYIGNLAAAAIAAGIAAGAAPAWAHAVIVSASPTTDQQVAPGKLPVRIEFNSRIDKARSRLQITAPAGDKTDIPIDQAGDPNVMAGTTGALTPGAYVLRWQVLAIDGHITRGDIPFVVGN
jgi:methionine-rich copper-binding protein CopC